MPRGIYPRKGAKRAKTYKRKTAPATPTPVVIDQPTPVSVALRGVAVSITAGGLDIVFANDA